MHHSCAANGPSGGLTVGRGGAQPAGPATIACRQTPPASEASHSSLRHASYLHAPPPPPKLHINISGRAQPRPPPLASSGPCCGGGAAPGAWDGTKLHNRALKLVPGTGKCNARRRHRGRYNREGHKGFEWGRGRHQGVSKSSKSVCQAAARRRRQEESSGARKRALFAIRKSAKCWASAVCEKMRESWKHERAKSSGGAGAALHPSPPFPKVGGKKPLPPWPSSSAHLQLGPAEQPRHIYHPLPAGASRPSVPPLRLQIYASHNTLPRSWPRAPHRPAPRAPSGAPSVSPYGPRRGLALREVQGSHYPSLRGQTPGWRSAPATAP